MPLGKKRSTNWLGKPVVGGEQNWREACGKPKGTPTAQACDWKDRLRTNADTQKEEGTTL